MSIENRTRYKISRRRMGADSRAEALRQLDEIRLAMGKLRTFLKPYARAHHLTRLRTARRVLARLESMIEEMDKTSGAD